jgi:Bacterial aa3 type cytochrome c oxidase subunit IV
MADHSPSDLASDMDYAEHERTYRHFLSLTKWVTITCVAILIFMAITLL